MKTDKNIVKNVSLYVITILFLSISCSKIFSTLSTSVKFDSIVLSDYFSLENENFDSEKDFSEEYMDFLILGNQKRIDYKYFKRYPKIQPYFLIPQVFYDIQIPPPEALLS